MKTGSYMRTAPSLSRTIVIHSWNQTSPRYGCCPDGLTRAKGLNFKGCDNATTCKDAKWGCCDDLMNPAHGEFKLIQLRIYHSILQQDPTKKGAALTLNLVSKEQEIEKKIILTFSFFSLLSYRLLS